MFEFYLVGVFLVAVVFLVVALFRVDSAKQETEKWKKYHGDLSECYSKAIEAKQEQGKRLITEIEARIAAEDAVHIITHIACALADKKRPKKKG